MDASTETKIWMALKSRADSIPLSFPKAWPAEKFIPPFGGSPSMALPYLRVGRVSADPARVFIPNGGKYDRSGALIITLVHPLGQAGEVYEQMAGVIADHFNDTIKLYYGGLCVSVPYYPSVNEGFEDSGYWTVPVRIPWRCFA